MELTYEWTLKSLKKATTNDITNAIIGTNWSVKGTNSDGLSGEFVGATPFDLKSIDTGSFIEYNDLTEELVLGWIKDYVSGSSPTNYWGHVSERIEKQITDQTMTVVEVGSQNLPWSEGYNGSDTYTPPTGSV